ncbi:hypothetical protein [Limihaloglobus sulfuriphilus]|uniref:hypothetical protein n=1 Tax=Limihaloglobus sulfuriphilus TaxID=1851148 RepID=UPI0011BA730A|nr:hypothetical protein [Limihaloglobus sulfuriphilus]
MIFRTFGALPKAPFKKPKSGGDFVSLWKMRPTLEMFPGRSHKSLKGLNSLAQGNALGICAATNPLNFPFRTAAGGAGEGVNTAYIHRALPYAMIFRTFGALPKTPLYQPKSGGVFCVGLEDATYSYDISHLWCST